MVFPFVFWLRHPSARVHVRAHVRSLLSVCLSVSLDHSQIFFSAGVNYCDFLYFDGDMLIYTIQQLGSKYVLSGMGSR